MPRTVPKLWKNWARNQTCAPVAQESPASESELVDIVKTAAAAERRVKVVGAGHSFTGIACTDGHLVDLTELHRRCSNTTRRARHGHGPGGHPAAEAVRRARSARARAREHGRHRLPVDRRCDLDRDARDGYALRQHLESHRRTAAGHCRRFGARVLDRDPTPTSSRSPGSGSARSASSRRSRCSACPRSGCTRSRQPMPVDDVLNDFDGFMNSTDHVEFYWVPHTRWALTKRNTRTQESAKPRARSRRSTSTTSC